MFFLDEWSVRRIWGVDLRTTFDQRQQRPYSIKDHHQFYKDLCLLSTVHFQIGSQCLHIKGRDVGSSNSQNPGWKWMKMDESILKWIKLMKVEESGWKLMKCWCWCCNPQVLAVTPRVTHVGAYHQSFYFVELSIQTALTKNLIAQ